VNCPICGLGLKLKGIEEHKDYALVQRYCQTCRVTWILKHLGNLIVSVTQEVLMGKGDYGFDYKCPHCGFESTVYTVFKPPLTGWKCLQCGKIVPNEFLKPRGDFQITPISVPTGRLRPSRKVSTYQRAPRVSEPTPEGAIALAIIAQKLSIAPKRLRSWLRKVGWRASEEAGSGWYFSPSEVEELKKRFGK